MFEQDFFLRSDLRILDRFNYSRFSFGRSFHNTLANFHVLSSSLSFLPLGLPKVFSHLLLEILCLVYCGSCCFHIDRGVHGEVLCKKGKKIPIWKI